MKDFGDRRWLAGMDYGGTSWNGLFGRKVSCLFFVSISDVFESLGTQYIFGRDIFEGVGGLGDFGNNWSSWRG